MNVFMKSQAINELRVENARLQSSIHDMQQKHENHVKQFKDQQNVLLGDLAKLQAVVARLVMESDTKHSRTQSQTSSVESPRKLEPLKRRDTPHLKGSHSMPQLATYRLLPSLPTQYPSANKPEEPSP